MKFLIFSILILITGCSSYGLKYYSGPPELKVPVTESIRRGSRALGCDSQDIKNISVKVYRFKKTHENVVWGDVGSDSISGLNRIHGVVTIDDPYLIGFAGKGPVHQWLIDHECGHIAGDYFIDLRGHPKTAIGCDGKVKELDKVFNTRWPSEYQSRGEYEKF